VDTLQLFFISIPILFFVGVPILLAISWRRVVPTNEVHIVQTRKETISYGKDTGNGNTYYEIPYWVPGFGVTKIKLPMSVFDLDLTSYEAYDKGRLPFVVDVKAFFRISESNIAAQRVSSFQELCDQLEAIVQGAVRTILAASDIEEIMQGRSKFGDEFTNEVKEQLLNWGVETVKNIELMDIRDAKGSDVIQNIMAKKKSMIEMESRQEVAKNQKQAELAEIEASQEVQIRQQDSLRQVGMRTVETQREVDLAKQTAEQSIKQQEKTTAEKQMEVERVKLIKSAEIAKDAAIVKAEQEKQRSILLAEGDLEAQKRQAEAVLAQGKAKAESEKAMQLAPVEAQIALAKEIGGNESYQNYLITVRKIEAAQEVGSAQAKALEKAEIKVISNAGDPQTGVTKVMDLFSSQGGTAVGAMLEALSHTNQGKALVDKFTSQEN
jgi:flotillin